MAFLDQLAFALATFVAAHLAGLADAHVPLVAALGLLGVLLVAIVLLLLAHLLAPVMDRGTGPSSVPRALFGLATGADQFAHTLTALAAGFADGGVATAVRARRGAAGVPPVGLVVGGGLLPSHAHLRGCSPGHRCRAPKGAATAVPEDKPLRHALRAAQRRAHAENLRRARKELQARQAADCAMGWACIGRVGQHSPQGRVAVVRKRGLRRA